MPVSKLSIWNRKLHIYLGLYFLLFIWLFAFSGLLLNHSQWEFARFWPNRKEAVSQHAIRPLSATEDMDRAREVMLQLGISGEIENIRRNPEEMQFRFRVVRPGKIAEVLANWEDRSAEIKEITTNGWGVMHFLHTFNGVRDSKSVRNWFGTTLWTFSMDALCLGLIFLVFSSLYMWYLNIKKRTIGWAVLGTGMLCCGFFMFGLSLLF